MNKNKSYMKKIRNMKSFNEVINSISRFIFRRRHIFWTNDLDIKSLLLERKVYKKLQKKYYYILKNNKNDNKIQKRSNKIWTCWLQGVENAPILVKKCIESIKNNFKDEEVIVITEENYQNYIHIPDYIVNKWKNGIISNAHFSDIIRIYLLTEYGGVWMDSTVYILSSNIPKYFYESPLFVFSNMKRNSLINISNWYICAYSHNLILEKVKELLTEYWKKENCAIHYFIFHMFFKMASDEYKDEWEKVPKFSNIQPHLLSSEILTKYDLDREKQISNACPIQKLNYKLDITKDISNSFYRKIIAG